MDIKSIIRDIPDYPKPGIVFKDITTLLKDSKAFHYVVDELYDYAKQYSITKVVSLESRGFIVGGALAYNLNAGFVPVRKKGKLPWNTIEEHYDLEYGFDSIEMHTDALDENDNVLIHDDLLATGGTAIAALNLVKQFNPNSISFSFICNLSFIETQKKERLKDYSVNSLIVY